MLGILKKLRCASALVTSIFISFAFWTFDQEFVLLSKKDQLRWIWGYGLLGNHETFRKGELIFFFFKVDIYSA